MSSYDQALLDEAPKASRAQLQQGYDVDLLEPRRTPSVRHPHTQTPQPTPVPLMPGFAETGPEEKMTSLSHPAASRTKPSFWRSRNGVITLIVIAVVVVGAVVGGAVGGTVNKHSNTTPKAKTSGPTSSSSPSPSHSESTPTPTTASGLSAGSVGTQPTGSSPPSIPSSSSNSSLLSEDNIHAI